MSRYKWEVKRQEGRKLEEMMSRYTGEVKRYEERKLEGMMSHFVVSISWLQQQLWWLNRC